MADRRMVDEEHMEEVLLIDNRRSGAPRVRTAQEFMDLMHEVGTPLLIRAMIDLLSGAQQPPMEIRIQIPLDPSISDLDYHQILDFLDRKSREPLKTPKARVSVTILDDEKGLGVRIRFD